ncbi:MAG: 50S ribosomal protein L35 [Nitrospinae bacterium]|nr:50S ribosomal protein L35 [Nitrospinota bacterium]
MLKTNKAAAKRFRVTAKGRLKAKKSFARHILTSKSSNKKRKLRKAGLLGKTDEKRMKKLIPYV